MELVPVGYAAAAEQRNWYCAYAGHKDENGRTRSKNSSTVFYFYIWNTKAKADKPDTKTNTNLRNI